MTRAVIACLAGAVAFAILCAGSADARSERAPAKVARRPVGGARIVALPHAPFPYTGVVPATGKPFLDAEDGGRRGHTARGVTFWEDATYSDASTLIVVPKTFRPDRPAVIVVFFHGNNAILGRDVRDRQEVPRQIAESGLNAVLVAPQFAVDAADSGAGKLYEAGNFDALMAETAPHVADLAGSRLDARTVLAMPIVIVAYSGGYVPAAYTLALTRTPARIAGVLLLDALYGEADKFTDWIDGHRQRCFFVSAFSKFTATQNTAFRQGLAERGIPTVTSLPRDITRGVVAFVSAPDAEHKDFVTAAWTKDPLLTVLRRVRGIGGERQRLKR